MPVTARRYVFAATRGFAPPHEVAGNFSKLERGYWGVLDIFTLSRHRRLNGNFFLFMRWRVRITARMSMRMSVQ